MEDGGKYETKGNNDDCIEDASLVGRREDGNPLGVKLLETLSDHSKYVVACRWAPDGSAFATASHDKVVTLYVRRDEAGSEVGIGETGYEQVGRWCVRSLRGGVSPSLPAASVSYQHGRIPGPGGFCRGVLAGGKGEGAWAWAWPLWRTPMRDVEDART